MAAVVAGGSVVAALGAVAAVKCIRGIWGSSKESAEVLPYTGKCKAKLANWRWAWTRHVTISGSTVEVRRRANGAVEESVDLSGAKADAAGRCLTIVSNEGQTLILLWLGQAALVSKVAGEVNSAQAASLPALIEAPVAPYIPVLTEKGRLGDAGRGAMSGGRSPTSTKPSALGGPSPSPPPNPTTTPTTAVQTPTPRATSTDRADTMEAVGGAVDVPGPIATATTPTLAASTAASTAATAAAAAQEVLAPSLPVTVRSQTQSPGAKSAASPGHGTQGLISIPVPSMPNDSTPRKGGPLGTMLAQEEEKLKQLGSSAVKKSQERRGLTGPGLTPSRVGGSPKSSAKAAAPSSPKSPISPISPTAASPTSSGAFGRLPTSSTLSAPATPKATKTPKASTAVGPAAAKQTMKPVLSNKAKSDMTPPSYQSYSGKAKGAPSSSATTPAPVKARAKASTGRSEAPLSARASAVRSSPQSQGASRPGAGPSTTTTRSPVGSQASSAVGSHRYQPRGNIAKASSKASPSGKAD